MKTFTFKRTLGLIAAICIIWLTCMFTKDYYRHTRPYEIYRESYSSECQAIYYNNDKVNIYHSTTGKITIEQAQWVVSPDINGDTLIVFSKKNKRGYFNRYTGERIIPEQYTHAWIFSEGLAAVVVNGQLGFINKHGKTVIPFQYPYLKDLKFKTDFTFHNGYCSMYNTSGQCGLINKAGKWVIKPQYDFIGNPVYGKRIFIQNQKYGMLNDSLQIIFSAKYNLITLTPEYCIVTNSDESKTQVDYQGNILCPMLYDNIELLDDEIEEYLPDGSRKQACVYDYTVGNKHGLMEKNGKLLTPPLYTSIEVVNKKLFRCILDDQQSAILLNDKGKMISHK